MVFVCDQCRQPFTTKKNLRIHVTMGHKIPKNKLKQVNKKRGAVSIAKKKQYGNDDSMQSKQAHEPTASTVDDEMDCGEIPFDSAFTDDATASNLAQEEEEEARDTTLRRELPVKSGIAVEYLLPLDQDVQEKKYQQSHRITQDDKELMFLQIVNENSLSAAAANSILNWARLFEGAAQNLPSYEVLKKKNSNRMKKDSSSNPLKARKFTHRVNFQVPPVYNGHKKGGVKFIYTDMMALAASIIDAVVKSEDQFHMNADLYNEHEQRRYNANFNSGNWWSRTENEENVANRSDATILLLVLFIDKTAVNRSGSRSSYPIILTVGNLDESVRFSPLAHRIVGYMPILESRSHQNTVGYKRESWRLRNACFTHLFKSVVDAYKNGGVYLKICNKEVCCIPCIPCILQDTQEGLKCCAVRGGGKTMHPCRHCFTPQARMSDVHSPFKGEQRVEKRIQASIQKTIETCVTALGSNVRGINKLVEDLAKKLSVNVIINALWYVPWGASKGGVYHGTPPELLHQFLLGLLKCAFLWAWQIVLLPPKKKNAATNLDNRFMDFNTKHNDKSIWVRHYPAGTKNLPMLEAKEYIGLVFQMIICLGTTETFLNADSLQKVQRALCLLLILHDALWEREKLDEQLAFIDKLVPNTLDAVKEAFEPVPTYKKMQRPYVTKSKTTATTNADDSSDTEVDEVESATADTEIQVVMNQFSKSDFNFYKFHAMHHLVDDVIKEFGSMQSVHTGSGENYNKTVKKLFGSTTRRKESQNEEMHERYVLGEAMATNLRKRKLTISTARGVAGRFSRSRLVRPKLINHDRLLGVKTTIFCYDENGESSSNKLGKRNIASVTMLQAALPHIQLNKVDINYKPIADTVATLLKTFLVNENKPQKDLTVTSYPKIQISVRGVAKKLQLEANSHSNKPWFDDIVYMAYLNDKNNDAPVLYAGKCILFFELTWRSEDNTTATAYSTYAANSTAYTTTTTADTAADTSAEDVTTQKKPVFLALVHRYETVKSMQSLTTNQKLYADNFNVEDPQLAKHSLVPFSHMKLSKTANGNPKLELIDTETISSAVWTQTDYDNPSYTWFLRYWSNRESQCEGLLTTPLLN